MSIFSRAAKTLNLTPGERATLKFIKSVAFAVLAFVLGGQGLMVLNQIQQPGANVGAILHDNLLTPCLLIVLLTVEKYFTAKGDAPLPQVTTDPGKSMPVGGQQVSQAQQQATGAQQPTAATA